MNRKKMMIACGLAAVMLLVGGCGSDNTKQPATVGEAAGQQTESTAEAETEGQTYAEDAYLSSVNVDDLVKIASDYIGIEVTEEPIEISDEELQYYIDMAVNSRKEKVEVDRAAQNGDVVNIDYEGKKDGVAFDGGTAQGYDLTLGSGTFIPGFEEGLIGAKKGETRDIELTFPEDYHAAELAGQAVVFTCKVNGVYEEKLPEFDDALVQSLGREELQTTEEYIAYIKEGLEEMANQQQLANQQQELIDQLMANVEITEVPGQLVDRYYDTAMNSIANVAAQNGVDSETYMQYVGMTEESLREEAENQVRQLMVFQVIAEKENLIPDEDELKNVAKTYADQAGLEVDEYLNNIDYESFKEFVLTEKVKNFLRENATVSEK